jgi:hypothetical protein
VRSEKDGICKYTRTESPSKYGRSQITGTRDKLERQAHYTWRVFLLVVAVLLVFGQTARYAEFHSTGPGGSPEQRVDWAKQLTKAEAAAITPGKIHGGVDGWNPKAGQ